MQNLFFLKQCTFVSFFNVQTFIFFKIHIAKAFGNDCKLSEKILPQCVRFVPLEECTLMVFTNFDISFEICINQRSECVSILTFNSTYLRESQMVVEFVKTITVECEQSGSIEKSTQ